MLRTIAIHEVAADSRLFTLIATDIFNELRGICTTMCVDEQLEGFLAAVSATYRANRYHSWRHAVAVTVAMVQYLKSLRIHISVSIQAALLIAAICHDAGHRGVPNTEIVKRSDELVSEHGPISTAERESCKILRAVLSNDSSNILAGFSAEAQAAIIGLAEIAILATDITNKGLHDGIMAECPEMVATLLRLDESLDVCTPFAPAFCCLLMICADLDCIRASVDSCLWWGRQLFKEIQLWNADFSASLFAEQQLSFFPSYVASIFSQLSKLPGLESAITELKAVQEYYCGLSASDRIAALL